MLRDGVVVRAHRRAAPSVRGGTGRLPVVPGGVLSIRPDQGAGSGAVDRKAEEGVMAEPWRVTTTRRGAAPDPASPA
ncbi:hypothetical protein BN2537_3193 [Streptomyces venezuelae]|nr:hypothetical protein BN2537_3193 [Streptomyces venezuelae]